MPTFKADGERLSDRVAMDIGRQIILGGLEPRHRLPTEAELCEIYGVSRSVVRDAIRTLAALGLVTVRPGRGIEVTDPNDKRFAEALLIVLIRAPFTVGDVMDARAALETELASLAAERASVADLEDIETELTCFLAAVRGENWSEAQYHHDRFHLNILAALRNPILELLLKPLQEIILISAIPPREDLWEAETHPPIFDALKARDKERVRMAMQRHFNSQAGSSYADRHAQRFGELEAVQGFLTRTLSRDGA